MITGTGSSLGVAADLVCAGSVVTDAIVLVPAGRCPAEPAPCGYFGMTHRRSS